MKSEFEFINDLKLKYSLDHVGDDCAVLPNNSETDLLISADLLVEDIDFRLEWTRPGLLGHKALAVSLSDIAAMGGTPKWSLASIGVPPHLWKSNFLDGFYEGWHKLAREHGVELVGGDVSRTPDKLIIDSIVGGEVAKGSGILRSTAKAGDLLCVTGVLGGAAGGLRLLERGFRYDGNTHDHTADLLLRQLHPQPQLYIANVLQHQQLATSLIDLSDGLSSDLAHIFKASGVGAKIHAEKLPAHPDLGHHFPTEEIAGLVLNGGEDLELLFTVSPKNLSGLKIEGVTCIGEMTETAGTLELVRNGTSSSIEPKGYRHF